MLLSDFFDRVYLPLRLRGKSENSVRLYRLTIKQFRRSLGRDPEIADLTEENVLAHLARRRTVAAATRNKELTQLSAMWRLANQRNLITTWPSVPEEPEPERDPIAWLPDEIQKLFVGISRTDEEFGGVPSRLFWNGLVRVILDTAERISAITAARWDWLSDDWLRVPAEARKGKTRDKSHRLSTSTMNALAGIRQFSSHDEIFYWPLAPTYLWMKFAHIVRDSGLPSGRRYSFHCLRKTSASVLYAAGVDPQDKLDHSHRRTTQRYLDPRFRRDQQACDIIAKWLNPDHSDRNKDSA